ncbi:TPA: hypothetical protein HA244_02395 [Candidatus Micrarchaeota archaeon]|nr:hypothetical protein [Candidatus Micrarchaeota archaeon]
MEKTFQTKKVDKQGRLTISELKDREVIVMREEAGGFKVIPMHPGSELLKLVDSVPVDFFSSDWKEMKREIYKRRYPGLFGEKEARK